MTIHKPIPFQKEAWYAVAKSDEVTRTPKRRLVLGQPLVLYRTEAGQAVSLEDRCCHRLAPLSPGKLIGDCIECPYHGLRFDSSGACTFVPGQETIPRRAVVRAYTLIERHALIWAWMGEGQPEPETLPDWRWAEDADWSVRSGYFHINCSYVLSVDNLMDLSHIGYVHATTIGSASDAEEAEVDTIVDGGRVTVRRWVENQPPSPGLQKRFGPEPVDRWQLIEFQAPCYIRTFKGMGKAIFGRPGFEFTSVEADPPEGVLSVSRGNTCVTPETETTCHYFTVHCHFRPPSERDVDRAWQLAVDTLQQDVAILEQTQENMALNPSVPMVFIHVDEGVEKARQAMRMAVKSEMG